MNLTSVNEAYKIAAKTVFEHLGFIPGLKDHHLNKINEVFTKINSGAIIGTPPNGDEGAAGITLEWERTWAVSGTLYLQFDRKVGKLEDNSKCRNYADKPKEVICEIYTARVEMSWSSTTRGIASSVAAIDLYQSITRLGALLQTQMEGLTIGNVYDKDTK